MVKSSGTMDADRASHGPAPAADAMPGTAGASASDPRGDPAGLGEKQAMVEKLFRHTNTFLAENRHDPLLVVEALAAILVRYAALLGPVEQMRDRLSVLERLIGQECAQIQEIAKTADWAKKA